jgi:hypothetical protein
MATTKRLYTIKIVLTKNNDAYEKEFIIDKMSQILLENFAEKTMETEIAKLNLLMSRENAYIDSDVLQQIKSLTSKSQNTKYKFMEFSGRNEVDIKNEFYETIGNYSLVAIRNDTLKFILQIALDFLKNDEVQTSIKSKVPIEKQAALQSERENEITKVNGFITRITSDANEETFYDDVIKQLFRLLTSKPLMSEIKNKYNIINKDKAKDKINKTFRTNLSNIMLNKSSELDDTIKFHTHEKYEYFLDTKYLDYIFSAISDNMSKALNPDTNSGIYRTPTLFNTKEKRMQIIKENVKYVFPNKTNIELLDDNEEQTVLLFHNILYIIKKIYLVDTTIINAEDIDSGTTKKFYVKNLILEENNPFIRSMGPDSSLIATIKFRADITYINRNPILKINYILDNKEILDNTIPLKISDFEPNNFLTNPSSNNYKSIYIYDTIEYNLYDAKIKRLLNSIKIQKIIKNKEEMFFNETALNEFNHLLDIKFEGLDKKITDPAEITENDNKIKDRNIPLNIIYLLKNVLKLYNGKEIKHNNDKYFVYDTLITYKLTDNEDITKTTPTSRPTSTPKFYSIAQNKVIDYKNINSEKVIKLFKKKRELMLPNNQSAPVDSGPAGPGPGPGPGPNVHLTDKFDVYKIIPKDERLRDTNTYLIFIVFLCYKADEQGNKPNMQKRLVAEVCLERARTLDKAFNDLFYTKLNIPETYLYTKLLNFNRSKKADPDKKYETNPDKKYETDPEKKYETNPDKKYETNSYKMKKEGIDLEEKKIIGGKKKYTLKIKHK